MIRELKEENEKLKALLAAAGGPAQVQKVDDEESKLQMQMMKEQLEANQREMEEMGKSWEQKLAESREREEEEEKLKAEENKAKLAGTPHLVNLNEDPMLDRRVIYDIGKDEPLICGRRNKNSSNKLQLGGTGIEPDHCVFGYEEDGTVRLKACNEKSMKHIRVNGELLKIINGQILRPNDRIQIGPSAIFLFKNMQREQDASMPDPDDDPISFDFAADEV